jgi:chromosome segregation ATPase
MRLLPRKQDVEKAKNDERKKEIDSGIALATRIDKLRETSANEEKRLKEWRSESIRLVQKEIDDYITVRDNLKKQTEEAEVYRKKLLAPLDDEWKEINSIKNQQIQEKQNIFLLKDEMKEEKKLLDREQENIRKVATEIVQKNSEIEKAKSETISLKKLAQGEYEIAREEHHMQTKSFEKTLSETDERKKEYEVALSLIEIRQKEVNEKEVDIIKREQHLETQQRTLRIAKEALNK